MAGEEAFYEKGREEDTIDREAARAASRCLGRVYRAVYLQIFRYSCHADAGVAFQRLITTDRLNEKQVG